MTLSLAVDGVSYTGWLSANVTRGLDQFAHSFEFRYVDRWSEGDAQHPLVLGAACEVRWLGEVLVSGWIDSMQLSVGSKNMTGVAAGRALTGDLVDCSAVHKTGQWRNATAQQIIADIVAPFGIKVTYDPQLIDTVQVKRFDLEHGERAFEAIDRLARLRAWLPTTTPTGGLHFARISRTAGLRSVTLDLRETLEREYESNQQDRYSTYRVTSQTDRAGGSARRAALEKFEITDASVKRYRPVVMPFETGGAPGEMKDHATWMRNTHAARAERLRYEVRGVLAPDGKAWGPGILVAVDDHVLGVNEVLVCASTTVRVDGENVSTNLQLARVEAYSIEPIPAKELTSKLRKL